LLKKGQFVIFAKMRFWDFLLY